MTLAQVAQQDFSRAFLHQVETGRSQPSTRVLRIIAGRLGTPVDYLLGASEARLEMELAVEQARILLARGDQGKALALLRSAAGQAWPLGSEARLSAAEALWGLGRQQEAQELLRAEEEVLSQHLDRGRLERLRGLRAGRRVTLTAAQHERLGGQAQREGSAELALEHYRAARLLREAEKAAMLPRKRRRPEATEGGPGAS